MNRVEGEMKGLREGVNGVNTEFQTTKNPPRRVFLILAEGLLSRR